MMPSISVADPGEGPRGTRAPIFRPKWGPNPPLPPPPRLIWRSGSATEYQLRPCACVCAELQESSISRLSWSFVKESAGLFIPQKLHSGVHRISQQSYESYIILRDRIVVGLVKSLNQGLWLQIRIHLTNKRIKEILKQTHQYNAKYLSQFNDKNGFRK